MHWEADTSLIDAGREIAPRLTIDDLTSTCHPYLTLAEGIKLAALAFTKDVATLSCCAA